MEVFDYKICEKTSDTLQMAATHIFERGHTQISFMKSVENGHKKTFLENLVRDYNAKKKNNDSQNYTTQKKKTRGHLILDETLGKN